VKLILLFIISSIYLLTYNLNQQNPSVADDLVGLFDFQKLGVHNMYVIALEELTYLSMISWDAYMNAFDEIFRDRGYVRLHRNRYMLTSLSIYVPRADLSDYYGVVVSRSNLCIF